jgi:HK97 family phage portal protein
MFEWLKKLFQKQSRSYNSIVRFTSGQAVWTPKDYENFAKEGYGNNVYVYSCVRLIAQSCAGIPWLLYEKKKDKIEELDYNHPLLKIWKRPNPFEGFGAWFEAMVSYLLLSGNTYIERTLTRPSDKLELYTLRPDRMKIVPGNQNNPITRYEYTVNGSITPLEPELILHIKYFNPLNDFYGMSPIEASARSIDHNNEARKWNVSLLQNSAQPSGILSTDQTLSEETRRILREQAIELYGGSKNAGNVFVAEAGLKFQPTGLSPVDMSWLEGSKLSAREIAIAYNVAPELIGDNSSKTYSNYGEARKALYQETVLPLMDYLKDAFNNWLVPLWGDNLYLDYDKDSIEALQEDQDRLYNRMFGAVDRGIITRNEAREMLGFEALKIPEADRLYIPFSLTPIDEEPKQEPTKESPEESIEEEETEKSFSQKKTLFSEEKIEELWEYKRKRYWDPWEKKWKKALKPFFDEQEKEVLKNIENRKAAIRKEDIYEVEQWNKKLKKLSKPLLLEIVQEGVESAINELGIEVDWNIDNPRVDKWIQEELGSKIQGINDTTLENLKGTLQDGIDLGEGVDDLAKRVRETYEDAKGYRAEVIARTETISAFTEGNRQLYQEAGVKQLQFYTATDERVCEECYSKHGNKYGIDEAGGMIPVHPQCRCTWIAVMEE